MTTIVSHGVSRLQMLVIMSLGLLLTVSAGTCPMGFMSGPTQLAGTDSSDKNNVNAKTESLDQFRSDSTDQALRTNQGVKVANNNDTLSAGERGPTLLEDFIFREKITHFDHERIPERIVHARGSGAHGYFQSYKDHSSLTKAGFLTDSSKTTPVFVRFSTVQGPRGSADTVRDVRGFATKFYTDEGVFDLVGNNIPVFFIQDAIEFPDFVHAVKMEPHNEIPTGQSAHDSFWDFVSLKPESAHMVMWAMSDRAIPTNYRMIEGFGIHTFRMINTEGKSSFVKFHWKPKQGVCSLVWDEAVKLQGADPDFQRRDLWTAIEEGNYPEWELGVQIVAAEDEMKFEFDILDPSKIIPEELVPVTILGKMVLNRNPDSFFAETEQVAFCPAHVVPGIDFSNDPLLQGRLFSYTDTQLSRLGGPNFHEIPINRPLAPNHNNQRDGAHRMRIDRGRAAYFPNSIDRGHPKVTPPAPRDGGFESYYERIDAHKIRARSDSFSDHFSQARLFWNSMSDPEKEHIISSYTFELGKVDRKYIREREVNEILANINLTLAARVATNLGITKPKAGTVEVKTLSLRASPSLSQMNLLPTGLKGRKVGILVANGVDSSDVKGVKAALTALGVTALVLGPSPAPVTTSKGKQLEVDAAADGMPSVVFDAVWVAGGTESVQFMSTNGVMLHYILEAYKHLKTIGVNKEAKSLIDKLHLEPDMGLIIGDGVKAYAAFTAGMAMHRVWDREPLTKAIPA